MKGRGAGGVRPLGTVAASLAAIAALLAGCSAPPDGTVLVASGFTDRVLALDARTGAVIDSIALDPRPGERDEPHGLAISPDGAHWYATLSHGRPTLWKLEAAGHRLVGRLALPLRSAGRVRLSPDGALAAVADYWRAEGDGPGQVALVRTADLTVAGVAGVCATPHDARFDPSGRNLAVACSGGPDVLVLDATTLEPLARHRVGALGAEPRPMNVAWSPDGRRIFAALAGVDAVAEMSALDDRAPPVLHPVGAHPLQLELARGGALAVVASRGGGAVTLLDIADGRRTSLPAPGRHPHGVAIDPAGRVAYLTYEGSVGSTGGVFAVDLRRGVVLWHTPAGVLTLGVAFLPG